MKQYTINRTIRITEQQENSLKVLEKYNVNVSEFIRDAIRDKIKKDWPKIREPKIKYKYPF